MTSSRQTPFHLFASKLAFPLLLLAALALFPGCGGGGAQIGGALPPAADDSPKSLTQVIAELRAAPTPAGVDTDIYDQLRDELIRVLTARGVSAKAPGPPQGEANAVADLYVLDGVLNWSYLNRGDYDQNGEVNIADLTQIGLNFNKTSTGEGWDSASLADGDGNGEVNIADVTPIGTFFAANFDQYFVFGSAEADGTPEKLAELGLDSATGSPRLLFSFDASQSGAKYFYVVPTDQLGTLGEPSPTSSWEWGVGTLGPLSVSPLYAKVNEPTSFDFGIDIDPSLNLVSAKLWLLDTEGQPAQELIEVLDSGVLAQNDDIAGDRRFNCRIELQSAKTERQQLVVIAIYNNGQGEKQLQSNVAELLFYAPLDFNRAQALSFRVNEVQDMLDDAVQQMTIEQAVGQVLADVADDADVIASGKSEEGQGLWWVTDDLIPCAASYFEADERGGSAGGPETAAPMVQPRPGAHPVGEPLPYAQLPFADPVGGAELKSASDIDLRLVGNVNVIGLACWQSDFAPNDEVPVLLGQFQQQTCPDFNEVLYQNAECTIERFKELDDYGTVLISSHGDSYFGTYTSPMWGSGAAGAQCVVLVRQPASPENLLLYNAELVAGQVVAGSWLAITPRFVRTYCSRMPNSIVYVGTCRSTFNDSLANAFLECGAAAFVGYSDYVGISWAYGWGLDFGQKLLAGANVAAAYTPGQVESDGDPARYDLRGRSDVRISAFSGLINGGFDYPLTGWSRAGDCRGIRLLGRLAPTEGRYMAIVSTGLGSVFDSQSALRQRFCVPNNALLLRMSYNVASEEPLEYLQSAFDDRWSIELRRLDGTVLATAAAGSVNTSTWFPAPLVTFDGGDETPFQIGWRSTPDIDLVPYRGQTVELVISCSDVGDSAYDTAVLADNVKIMFP